MVGRVEQVYYRLWITNIYCVDVRVRHVGTLQIARLTAAAVYECDRRTVPRLQRRRPPFTETTSPIYREDVPHSETVYKETCPRAPLAVRQSLRIGITDGCLC